MASADSTEVNQLLPDVLRLGGPKRQGRARTYATRVLGVCGQVAFNQPFNPTRTVFGAKLAVAGR